jgi:predicted Zn-dependent protease
MIPIAQALALVAVGVLVLQACLGQTLLVYDTSEGDRSRLTAARIESEWPLVEPGRVVRYVQTVALRLKKAAAELYGPLPYRWHFKVVRDRAVTAFAIGGGRIYVSDGALNACRDDAEFAALLAHEMGHQIEGHFQEPQAPSRRSDGQSHLPMGSLRLALDPGNELEADKISIELLRAAGYDPRAALRVAKRTLEQSEAQSGHPWSNGRIALLRQLLADISPYPSRPSIAFLEAKRALAQP